MKYLKTYESYTYQDNEILEEGWKNWAIALGIAASSLMPNHANASTQGIGDGLKDRVVSIINGDLTIKNLEKDGYSPAPGTMISSDKKIVDSGIEAHGQTKSAAELSLQKELQSKGIDYGNRKAGFIVYKTDGSQIFVKWISLQ